MCVCVCVCPFIVFCVCNDVIMHIVNKPYFVGRNTSGHTCTALLAGRNVGLRNARYNLTTSMQSTQSIFNTVDKATDDNDEKCQNC